MANSPQIIIPDPELDRSGYTGSGKTRYKKTVNDYNDLLYEKSIHFGDIDKAPNSPREVTHEHVKAAAHSIAKSFGKPVKPKWFSAAKIGQFVFAALFGLATGNFPDTWALILFIVSFGAGTILLFLTEKENSK